MKVPVWAADLAAAFWKAAGEAEPFPRNLRNAIARATPLSVVSLPQLGIEAVSRWLANMKVACRIEPSDRPLHGMLVTFRGVGFVFLDGADSDDEQRFSLAHELAHFLRDYWRPRERVRRRLGEAATEVLDGSRPAHFEERVMGAIERLPLQCQVHLLERGPDAKPATQLIRSAEWDADRLAFELLAPVGHVVTQGLARRPRHEWPAALQENYGLPGWAAERYVQVLIPEKRSDALLGLVSRAIRGGS